MICFGLCTYCSLRGVGYWVRFCILSDSMPGSEGGLWLRLSGTASKTLAEPLASLNTSQGLQPGLACDRSPEREQEGLVAPKPPHQPVLGSFLHIVFCHLFPPLVCLNIWSVCLCLCCWVRPPVFPLTCLTTTTPVCHHPINLLRTEDKLPDSGRLSIVETTATANSVCYFFFWWNLLCDSCLTLISVCFRNSASHSLTASSSVSSPHLFFLGGFSSPPPALHHSTPQITFTQNTSCCFFFLWVLFWTSLSVFSKQFH